MTDGPRDTFDDDHPTDDIVAEPPAESYTEAWDYGPGNPGDLLAGSGSGESDHDPGTWHDGTPAPTSVPPRAPAANTRSEAATPEVENEPAEPPAPAEDRQVVVLGPMQSGKTVLLLSLLTALLAWGRRSDDDARLARRWWMEMTAGEGAHRLAQEYVRTIVEEGFSPLASSELQSFDFSVSVTEERGLFHPPVRTDANLRFFDGPGGHVIHAMSDWGADRRSYEYEAATLDAAREAGALVLTVDASNPQQDVLSGELAHLIGHASVDTSCPPPASPWPYRLMRRLGLSREEPPVATTSRRLGCDNFLVLLTKVDRIVAPEVLEASIHGDTPPGDVSRMTPLEAAWNLDPLGQALEAVGRNNLLTIHNALRPDARLAVGLCSAWGFNPGNGQPFMNREGSDPVRMSSQERRERVKLMTPFGVQDALRFTVTGSADGTVRRVTRDDLADAPGPHPDPSGPIAARLRFGCQQDASRASESWR